MCMELSRNSFEPLYYQIRENLREKINNHEYSPGSMIPTEVELCEYYGVSRVTVRRAILDLVQEGLLNRGQGRGTFVAESYGLTTVNGVQSFSQELLGMNLRPTAKVLSCKVHPAGRSLREILELEEGEQVITISRLRLADNEPCMVEVMNFPYRLVAGLEREDLTQSVYHLLKIRYDCEVVKAKDVMEAIIIGDYESHLLELTMPSAGMRSNRTGFDANNRPIEYTTHIIPAKKCILVFDHTN